jgi:hypothetical protein
MKVTLFPLLTLLAFGLAACPESIPKPIPEPPVVAVKTWEVLGSKLPSALLSVAARSPKDVIAVGADKGKGPLVVKFDGAAWSELKTGFRGDLWWVHSFPESALTLMAGQGAQVLSYDGASFKRIPTPGFAKQTIFGIWGKAPDDVYAVGSAAGRDGFVWHWDGIAFTVVELPQLAKTERGEVPGLFKVWGTGDDVWVVGSGGTILRRTGKAPFEVVPSGTQETLFTVTGSQERVLIVGGGSNGVLLERTGSGMFEQRTPPASPLLQGVSTTAKGDIVAGERGQVYVREPGKIDFVRSETSLQASLPMLQSLHAVALDAEGDAWSVGGNVLSPSLDDGALLHFGSKPLPKIVLQTPPTPDGGDALPPAVCPAPVIAIAKDKTIARRWDEQILASIRRDLPRPTVHARNLYHLSAAMWDAWAAYEPSANGVFVREKVTAANLDAARKEAISYAAYRVLSHRYKGAVDGAISVACYRAVMTDLGYDPADMASTGDSPRALGNRIGETVIAQNAADGAFEDTNYKDPAPNTNPNLKKALIIDEPGVPSGTDPSLWQPLNLAVAATQNGIVLPAGTQGYIGSQWGGVKPFAMTRASVDVPWKDAGPAPSLQSPEMKAWVTEVIRRSSELDPNDGATVDISPKSIGNNPLGSNAGTGYTVNPVTGVAYAPDVVRRGDFGRALAEFWADGPKSETPPGHWNVLANGVADAPETTRALFGTGTALSPLSWDVHVYLALNGALHDADIAAWDIKRRTQTARPLTLIRYMAQNGQSTDAAGPLYNADGLPLTPGLIELVSKESAAPGQRHAALRPFIGTIAIRSWLGEPGDRTTQVAGAGWIRAVDWLPYQRRNFVTPAFPAFVSGHSTFSRAAAEVLTSLTGTSYFPGGFASDSLPKDTYLSFEKGPSTPVRLQWATYYDAADQAGQSRLWGGIHIAPDDFGGRRIGSEIGTTAVAAARTFYGP